MKELVLGTLVSHMWTLQRRGEGLAVPLAAATALEA